MGDAISGSVELSVSRQSWHESDASPRSMKWHDSVTTPSLPNPSVRAALGAVTRAPSQGLAAFNGVWASKDDGEIQGQILGTKLVWSDGSSTQLNRHGEH